METESELTAYGRVPSAHDARSQALEFEATFTGGMDGAGVVEVTAKPPQDVAFSDVGVFVRRPCGETEADVCAAILGRHPNLFGLEPAHPLTIGDVSAARRVLSLSMHLAFASSVRGADDAAILDAMRGEPEDLEYLYSARYDGEPGCMRLSFEIPAPPAYAAWLWGSETMRRASRGEKRGGMFAASVSLEPSGADGHALRLSVRETFPEGTAQPPADISRGQLAAAAAMTFPDALATIHLHDCYFTLKGGRMHWKAGSALGALWHQAYTGEDGGIEQAVCRVCGSPFPRWSSACGRKQVYCRPQCQHFALNHTRKIPRTERRAFIEGGGLREEYRRLHG